MEITYQEWLDTYKPIKNPSDPHNELLYFDWTNKDDVAILNKTDVHNIWTSTDGDGIFGISNGYRRINRMAYYITEVPWVGDEYIFIKLSEDVECECYDAERIFDRGEAGDPECEKCEGYGYKVEYFD